jgi:ferrochelatase
MTNDGIKRALAFATAGYSSYSSCRQYIENIENARVQAGEAAPQIEKIRPFYNHPRFISANAQELLIALNKIEADRRNQAKVIFTAHSIPMTMASVCRYAAQLRQASNLVMASAKIPNSWQVAYQSRSGSLQQPWLEPDISNAIEDAAQEGIKDIVIVPIGFVSDHMEIIYDLDTQAKELCEKLKIGYQRTRTAGSNSEFILMIRDLIQEKLEQNSLISSRDTDLNKEYCYQGCCPIG